MIDAGESLRFLAYVWLSWTIGGWLMAATAWLELITGHRRPDWSMLWYLVDGVHIWSADAFAPSGAFAHRLLLTGGVMFMTGLLALCLILSLGGVHL